MPGVHYPDSRNRPPQDIGTAKNFAGTQLQCCTGNQHFTAGLLSFLAVVVARMKNDRRLTASQPKQSKWRLVQPVALQRLDGLPQDVASIRSLARTPSQCADSAKSESVRRLWGHFPCQVAGRKTSFWTVWNTFTVGPAPQCEMAPHRTENTYVWPHK